MNGNILIHEAILFLACFGAACILIGSIEYAANRSFFEPYSRFLTIYRECRSYGYSVKKSLKMAWAHY